MGRTEWLRRILSIGGVVESGVGLVLVVDPSALAWLLLRAPLAGPGVAVGRLAGGALVGLGIACWSARRTPSTPAGVGSRFGFLVYNLVACPVLMLARPPWPAGLAALVASVLHGLLAAALVATFLAPGRARAEA
jgi:hypothetical protein